MKVYISSYDLDFLRDNFKKISFFKNLFKTNNENNLFDLSEREVEEVLDELSELLVQKGVNIDGELNVIGLKIEMLIDQFNQAK